MLCSIFILTNTDISKFGRKRSHVYSLRFNRCEHRVQCFEFSNETSHNICVKINYIQTNLLYL